MTVSIYISDANVAGWQIFRIIDGNLEYKIYDNKGFNKHFILIFYRNIKKVGVHIGRNCHINCVFDLRNSRDERVTKTVLL